MDQDLAGLPEAVQGNPTVEVRESVALDADVVDRALKAEMAGLEGRPTIRLYPSGASNLTYAVDYPNRRLVLRRPPFGYIPQGGHDMFREYRIMRDLKPVFPTVPEVLLYQDNETSVLGREFYVMERVEGHILHLDIPADWGWDAMRTRALCERFVETLVELHRVDWRAIGLTDFGRPEGYVERQITGWNRRWEKAWTEDVDRFEDVQRWLVDEMPTDSMAMGGRASVLHGDYRIDNCILDARDPTRVSAVLDWEICAIGDPLMDLGNTLCYWIEADDPDELRATARQPSQAPGMMSRREVLEFYATRTGADVGGFNYYYVYGIWRLAVVVQQLFKRYHDGATDDPRFAIYPRMVMVLGELARKQIAKGEL